MWSQNQGTPRPFLGNKIPKFSASLLLTGSCEAPRTVPPERLKVLDCLLVALGKSFPAALMELQWHLRNQRKKNFKSDCALVEPGE